jgi:seryl-tRNA synthetase
MIDLKLLAKDFDFVVEQLQRKKVDSVLLEELKTVYVEFKSKKQDLEQLQAEQNSKSKLFGIYMKEGKDISELKKEVSENKQKVASLNDEVREIEEKMSNILIGVPNIPADEVPNGADENDNVELEKILTPKEFSFEPKAHYELGEKLNWLDFERGTKLAKSRFTVIKNQASKLERALINYMLDFNGNCGFTETSVPFIANANTLTGTGQLPKFKDDLFKIEGEELYLIPTGEVPLTNLFADEIIPESELPIKLTAVTPSFRKEAGSGGRDIRGIIRQHQFYKVELVAITKQDESENMLNSMVDCVSKMLTELELPHRKVLLCSGDLGFSASKTIDIEVWLPSQKTYREISSISNTQDFQARRSKIRYKTAGKKGKNILAHTLNGSSLAVGRTLVAIMENYQTENGDIQIPEVLKKYL